MLQCPHNREEELECEWCGGRLRLVVGESEPCPAKVCFLASGMPSELMPEL